MVNEPQEHTCPQNMFSTRGVQVLYGPSLLDRGFRDWILQVARIATTQDVYDGEAEMVGDVKCKHEFVIAYCPFCGAKLNDGNTTTQDRH